DDCGNSITVDQIITVNDDIDPTASNPADITVPGGPAPAPDPTVVDDEADNCTANPVVAWVSDVSDNGLCPEIITRTYSVTDDCGNQITVEQLIYITDPFNPTASDPAPVAVQCIGDVPAPDPTVVTDEADNNGVPTVTWEDDTSDGLTCPETITRRYRVTDPCANYIFVEQIITVNDDINPTASNPAPTTVACASDVPAVDINIVTDEADNCTANPVVALESETSNGNVCNGEIITRIYSVTDDCGNYINVTHTITIDAFTPTFTLSSSDPTTCGGTDGFITISGLNPNENYDVSYNGNAPQSIVSDANGEYTFGNLSAGSYTDFSVNPSSCPQCIQVDNTVINLVDPNAPAVNAGVDQTICEGEDVTLTANNPDGANITWNNGVNDGVPFSPAVGTVNYTVTADLMGCISTDVVSVTVNPLPPVFAGNDIFICAGESVTLNATGANSFTWDNGVTNGVSFTPSATQTYTVEGNSLGCLATDEVVVTVYEMPVVSFEADNLVGCIPQEVNFSNTTTASIENCEWNIGGVILTGCDVSHVFTVADCYDVQLTVTTTDGCVDNHIIQNYVCIDDYPSANFSSDPSELTSIFNQTQFSNLSSGATTYEWDFGDGNGSNAVNPTHSFPNEEEGEFDVQLIATSQYGCKDTAYQTIYVREELLYFVPNTFTPDKDKFNETFKPVFTSGFDPQDYKLLVFDRWGEVIFESNNAEIGWDGTYGIESTEKVKDGTYIWKIEFKTKYNDERIVEVGHVNILR
ncbi:MAG: PKD domain-containing protein, partial [Brumimicrobium sp.]|nr:PKD domain-containing protein [Brumimicrobium sp.]